MNLKILALSFILLSVIFATPLTAKASSSQSLGPGKMNYVIAGIAGGPVSVDPSLAYDTASGELIQNVYDPLIFLNGSSASDFVPWLASSYSVSADGLTYQFIIRPNVPWQNASYGFVTPADAEYSLKKVLVREYSGGPAWLLWFPIFGLYTATDFGNLSDPAVATTLGNLINDAITSNATGLTIHFQTGEAYPPFLGILANTWGSIQSEQWCIDHSDWNPAVDKLSDGTWVNARNPSTSPLDKPSGSSTTGFMMGSGPYKFDFLNAGIAWSISRNTAFWGGWGTSRAANLGMSIPTRGYLDNIVEYFISEYATRSAGFTGVTPIYDTIAVPGSVISTVWQQPGIRCIYPLPELDANAMLFNYNVSMLSPLIGNPTDPTYFGEAGIRPDFFSDVHVRKAMAYSFNWTQYISLVYLGEAKQNAIPVPDSVEFFNASLPKYEINITRAVEEWKLAWGGNSTSPGPVWTQGFLFTILYTPSSLSSQGQAATILKNNVQAQNPKFHINVAEESRYPYRTYVSYSWRPVFLVGWLADYQDVNDWVTPFMQSSGTFSFDQHISLDPYSSLMDNLILNGAHNATFEGRNANYQQLWNLYIQETPSIPLVQPVDRRWARDWVHGWYFNPLFPGVYAYTMWKEALPWEDINEDGKVDIKDLATAAKGFGSVFIQPVLPPNPPGTPGYYSPNWNSRADVNVVNLTTGARGDMKVDIKDLATIALQYGYVAPAWQPGP